jgi:hypothetical protein
VVVDPVLSEALLGRPSLIAVVALPGEMILPLHVLPLGVIAREPPVAGVTLIVGSVVAGRATVVVAGAPTSRKDLATGTALVHGDGCVSQRADEVESGKEEREVEGAGEWVVGGYAEPRTWTAMQTTQMPLRYPHPVLRPRGVQISFGRQGDQNGKQQMIGGFVTPPTRDAVQPEREASPPGFIAFRFRLDNKEDSLLQSDANLMINEFLQAGVISAKQNNGRFIPNNTKK